MNKKESNLIWDISEYIELNICIPDNPYSNPADFKLLGDTFHKNKKVLPKLVKIQKYIILNSRQPNKEERIFTFNELLEEFNILKGGK